MTSTEDNQAAPPLNTAAVVERIEQEMEALNSELSELEAAHAENIILRATGRVDVVQQLAEQQGRMEAIRRERQGLTGGLTAARLRLVDEEVAAEVEACRDALTELSAKADEYGGARAAFLAACLAAREAWDAMNKAKAAVEHAEEVCGPDAPPTNRQLGLQGWVSGKQTESPDLYDDMRAALRDARTEGTTPQGLADRVAEACRSRGAARVERRKSEIARNAEAQRRYAARPALDSDTIPNPAQAA